MALLVVAKYVPEPGAEDVVEQALHKMAPEVRRHEDGCLSYEVSRSTDDPVVYLLYERYRDQAAIDAHRETPHYQELIQRTIAPRLRERIVEIYEPLE